MPPSSEKIIEETAAVCSEIIVTFRQITGRHIVEYVLTLYAPFIILQYVCKLPRWTKFLLLDFIFH